MKLEFSESFAEFFHRAICDLQKIMTIKIYAMDSCLKTFRDWVDAGSEGSPEYDVKVLTNNQMSEKSLEDIVKFT